MKVCMITTAFPRWPGDGQGAFVWEAIQALVKQDLEVSVVAMHSPGLPVRQQMGAVTILRPHYWLPVRWEMLRRDGGGLPIVWQKRPYVRSQIVPFIFVHSLQTLRTSRDCDIIHAHWTLSGVAGLVAAFFRRKPLLVTVHGSDIFRVTQSRIGAILTRAVLQRADHIMAVSGALARATVCLGIPEHNITVIPDGVDTGRFTAGTESLERTILFVGSLIERKGVRHLLAAMPAVLGAYPDHRLVIIGDGPQEAELRLLAEQLGIAASVDFLGFRPQEEVRAHMQRTRLFVLPSLEEGLGVVLLEALACGTPVVGSNVDGIPETISPEVGLLVAAGNPPELAAAICRAIGEPQRWETMSRAARARAVTVYDWERIAERWLALYQSMLASKPAGTDQ